MIQYTADPTEGKGNPQGKKQARSQSPHWKGSPPPSIHPFLPSSLLFHSSYPSLFYLLPFLSFSFFRKQQKSWSSRMGRTESKWWLTMYCTILSRKSTSETSQIFNYTFIKIKTKEESLIVSWWRNVLFALQSLLPRPHWTVLADQLHSVRSGS